MSRSPTEKYRVRSRDGACYEYGTAMPGVGLNTEKNARLRRGVSVKYDPLILRQIEDRLMESSTGRTIERVLGLYATQPDVGELTE